jgi:hypothetical protein
MPTNSRIPPLRRARCHALGPLGHYRLGGATCCHQDKGAAPCGEPTGSAPGVMGLALAKLLFRCKTMWIDTIANCEEMSDSGRRARDFADVWLTQWPQLPFDFHHLLSSLGRSAWHGLCTARIRCRQPRWLHGYHRRDRIGPDDLDRRIAVPFLE